MKEQYCICKNFYGKPIIRYYATDKCFVEYEIPSFDVEIEITDKNIEIKNGKIVQIETNTQKEEYS